MDLYHYTSVLHLKQILDQGVINITNSNLLAPANPTMYRGAMTDQTDSYHPLVWLSDVLDFETAVQNGLEGAMDKTQVAIVIHNASPPTFQYWVTWARKIKKRQGMDSGANINST